MRTLHKSTPTNLSNMRKAENLQCPYYTQHKNVL